MEEYRNTFENKPLDWYSSGSAWIDSDIADIVDGRKNIGVDNPFHMILSQQTKSHSVTPLQVPPSTQQEVQQLHETSPQSAPRFLMSRAQI
jgi:hypothetical protein